MLIADSRQTARHGTTDVGAAPRRRRRGPVDGIPYGWVPAPPVPPLSVAAPAAPVAPPAAVDLASLVRVTAPVAAPAVAPASSVTAATVAELLLSRLQAETASLDELQVRWAHEDEPAVGHDGRPVATIG